MVNFITSHGDFIKCTQAAVQCRRGAPGGQKILPEGRIFPIRQRDSRKGFRREAPGNPLMHPARSYSRPLAWSYSSDAQMNGPTPLQSFSMTGSEM